jgi:hypothetical protein
MNVTYSPDGTHYWDGYGWRPVHVKHQHVSITVCLVVVGVLGLVLNNQSVSLASGSGVVWTGAALAIIASVVAFAVPNTPTWVKVVLIPC